MYLHRELCNPMWLTTLPYIDADGWNSNLSVTQPSGVTVDCGINLFLQTLGQLNEEIFKIWIFVDRMSWVSYLMQFNTVSVGFRRFRGTSWLSDLVMLRSNILQILLTKFWKFEFSWMQWVGCWMRHNKRSVPVWAKCSQKSHVRLSNTHVEDNERVHTRVYKRLIYK